jgi:hypothetical protein
MAAPRETLMVYNRAASTPPEQTSSSATSSRSGCTPMKRPFRALRRSLKRHSTAQTAATHSLSEDARSGRYRQATGEGVRELCVAETPPHRCQSFPQRP